MTEETEGWKWTSVGPTDGMGTLKHGRASQRRGRNVETVAKAAGNKWKGVETTIRMVTVKVGKSCSRTPRKPESGGESAGNRCKGVEWGINIAKRPREEVGEGRNSNPDGEVTNGQVGITDAQKTPSKHGRR